MLRALVWRRFSWAFSCITCLEKPFIIALGQLTGVFTCCFLTCQCSLVLFCQFKAHPLPLLNLFLSLAIIRACCPERFCPLSGVSHLVSQKCIWDCRSPNLNVAPAVHPTIYPVCLSSSSWVLFSIWEVRDLHVCAPDPCNIFPRDINLLCCFCVSLLQLHSTTLKRVGMGGSALALPNLVAPWNSLLSFSYHVLPR